MVLMIESILRWYLGGGGSNHVRFRDGGANWIFVQQSKSTVRVWLLGLKPTRPFLLGSVD